MKKEWLVLAHAFPAVFVNLGHGHNGVPTAALTGAALVQLDRRPSCYSVAWPITKFTRPEWIAHRDFTPIKPVDDDALLEYARTHRMAAE